MRECEVDLIVLTEGPRVRLTDPGMSFVEIEVEAGDVLRSEERNSVIDLA